MGFSFSFFSLKSKLLSLFSKEFKWNVKYSFIQLTLYFLVKTFCVCQARSQALCVQKCTAPPPGGLWSNRPNASASCRAAWQVILRRDRHSSEWAVLPEVQKLCSWKIFFVVGASKMSDGLPDVKCEVGFPATSQPRDSHQSLSAFIALMCRSFCMSFIRSFIYPLIYAIKFSICIILLLWAIC